MAAAARKWIDVYPAVQLLRKGGQNSGLTAPCSLKSPVWMHVPACTLHAHTQIHACTHTCMHTHTHSCMQVGTHAHTHTRPLAVGIVQFGCMCLHAHEHMQAHMAPCNLNSPIQMCVSACTHTHTHAHTHTHVCTHTHAHPPMYTVTHTHTSTHVAEKNINNPSLANFVCCCIMFV